MKPNLVLVLIDSLNRQMLRPYNPAAVAATENLERFAARARRFDQHFVGSLPCMPARREIFTGRKEWAWRPWGPLEPYDERLPRQLAAEGYVTGIVTDHYHYWEEEANGYLQSFDSSELVRGHELDRWRPPLAPDAPVPDWVEAIEAFRPGQGRRYYANVRGFEGEEDFFPAKVMRGAAQWLRGRAGRTPFFLQVESFDVHEPFHVPEPYASMVASPTDSGGFNVWPPYQDPDALERFMAQTSPEELSFLRSQYVGKLAMVDRALGALWDTLDDLALWDETMVVVTTDHGHDLGERGVFGKQWPHYDSHAQIPLFVWHPDFPGSGEPVTALTSTVDLYATLLDSAGAAVPARPGHSHSLLDHLRGDPGARDTHVYGTFGQGVGITDGDWTLLKSPVRGAPLFGYSPSVFASLTAERTGPPVASGFYLDGVAMPQWKIPMRVEPLSYRDRLYHRRDDPEMRRDRLRDRPEQAERMLRSLRGALEVEGAPPEQFERLGLS